MSKKKETEPDQLERFRLSHQEFFCLNQIHSLDGVGMVMEPRIFREWSAAWGVGQDRNYEFRDDSEEQEPIMFISVRLGTSYGP
jgi:hypothetical protein